MADERELLDLAREVAAEAAGLVARMRAAGVEVAGTKSSPVDVVTEADRATERLVRDRILAARPDDGVLGEEGADIAGTSGVRWIVDPIDGTVNYLYGLAPYAVSIAAELDGTVVAGVVRDVAGGTAYAAALGHGATADGVPLRVRTGARLSQALLVTGFNYDQAVRDRQGRAMARLLPQVRDIRRLGACSLDLCAVAAGRADAYLEEGVHLWDYAAGALVATEAGARFDVRTGPNGLIRAYCAAPDLFEPLDAAAVDAGL